MILVVGGIKGGVGKSTIAANLAVLQARQGRSVLLVDADSQGTSEMWAAARAEAAEADAAAVSAPVTTVTMSGASIRGNCCGWPNVSTT